MGTPTVRTTLRSLSLAALVAGAMPADQVLAQTEHELLKETVEFTGAVLFLETGVPGLVIGATRNRESAVAGFGETSKGSGKAPDGDTLMRIGSITKVFTGAVLASLVADGTVQLTDSLADHLAWDTTVPERDGHVIRLLDLATHTSGLPREVEREPGPPDDPFSTLTAKAYARALGEDPLLFTPGTGGHPAAAPAQPWRISRIVPARGLRDGRRRLPGPPAPPPRSSGRGVLPKVPHRLVAEALDLLGQLVDAADSTVALAVLDDAPGALVADADDPAQLLAAGGVQVDLAFRSMLLGHGRSPRAQG